MTPESTGWDAQRAVEARPISRWSGVAWRGHRRTYEGTDWRGSLLVSARYHRAPDTRDAHPEYSVGELRPAFLVCAVSGGIVRMLPVRPVISLELVEAVVRAYGLTLTGDPIDLGGSSNLNLLLPGSGRAHVARIYRAWVPAPRLEGLQAVRAALRAAGLPFPPTRLSVAGQPWISFAGWLVEVEPFVGGQDMRAWRELLVGLRLLGRMHEVLRGITAPPATRRAPTANHIDAADAFETTRRACAAIRSWAASADDERIASRSEELTNALWTAGDEATRAFPRQLLYGDFWDNNVKFRNGSVAAVLDLDFMEEGARIDDVALVL